MPIFEYECRTCGHQFEALVGPTFPAPTCPECQASDLEQKISMFAVSSEGTRNIALKDGRKRAESVRRDKQIADAEYVKNHEH